MSRGLNDFNSDYVYRVLRPNEDPDSDLTCANSQSTCTIGEHVESGLRIPTRFISTTTDMDKALKWMETADDITFHKYRNRRRVIVKIDIKLIKWKYPNVANSAYDLSTSNNRDHFLKNDRQKSFAGAYSEVAFKRSIPSEAVSVCYTTKDRHVNRKRKKASVTRSISSDRTTQYVHSITNLPPQLPNYQPGIAAKYNPSPIEVSKPTTLKGINAVVEKSSSKLSERVGKIRVRGELLSSINPETTSLQSNSRSNQTQHLYPGYNDVFDYEKSYQTSNILSNLASSTREENDIKYNTSETTNSFKPSIRRNQSEPKHHSVFGNAVDYERRHQPYNIAIPSPEVRNRDSNYLGSTNLEERSLKSRFRSNQVPDHFDYLGYGNVSEHEKRYQPSKVSSSSQRESRTRVKSDLNPTTLETKRHSTQDFLHNQAVEHSDYSAYNDLIDYSSIYQPSNLSLPSQASKTSSSIKPSTGMNPSEPEHYSILGDLANYEEYYPPYNLKRDKIGVSSNFETENSSRPSIPARPLPYLREDFSEPRDYSNYERSYQPRQFEVSGLPDRAHYRTRQSSTDFQSLNPFISSLRTEQPQPQPQPKRNPAYSNVLGYEGSYQPNRSAIPSQFNGAGDRIRQSSTDYGTTGYSRPSLRTNMSPPEITPYAPRNKPLWKKFFSFFSRPFKSNK